MGLRDYEFDVSPELVAAVVRGRPGPLMDAAMAHMGNIAEAAREAERRAQNERDRAMVQGVEEGIAASIQDGDLGLQPSGIQQGAIPTLSDPARGLQQGRGVSRRGPFGNGVYGSVGSIPGRSRPETSPGSVGSIRKNPISVPGQEVSKNPAGEPRASLNEQYFALLRLSNVYSTQAGWVSDAAAVETDPDLRRQMQEMVVALLRKSSDYFQWATRISPETRRRDSPEESPSTSTAPSGTVDVFYLYAFLSSLGGLGVASQEHAGRGARTPAILNAINPSPDADAGGRMEFVDF